MNKNNINDIFYLTLYNTYYIDIIWKTRKHRLEN